MNRDPRYDVLFEPVPIGPVVAKNRFYQVPHCNGMGHQAPMAHAAMRAMKAEGGWAVVSTEEVEIHPSGDITPYIEGRLWDERDIPYLRLMTDAVHAYDALAAIELVHNGPSCANLNTRVPPIAPSHVPVFWHTPAQARAMTKRDIADYRRWHRTAALRAKDAGFDIIYVYAGHNLSLPMHFLSRRRNHRSDEYGGALENRVRLLRELLEDTKDAVGGTCAVAIRFAVDELAGPDGISADGEGREVVEMLAELPDLWDVNIADWVNDSQTARFAEEGFQEPYTAFVKRVTSKPVVGVGRFTSPDTMVSQINRGIIDLIGAARPSIADPFLPRKIENGAIDRIRECIGCNICVSGDMTTSPIRCTQNPAMGEEWRRGWHPESAPFRDTDRHLLIVGAGPAGLEAARVASLRGYRVTLAEATKELGGRVLTESRLPGLASWIRVRDYRESELRRFANAEVYRESRITVDDVLELAPDHVALATGASWRRDGVGRAHHKVVPGFDRALTPDDIASSTPPSGRVVVFDDDHYIMGGALAEKLARAGCTVILVTPAASVSAWTTNTLEHGPIQKRMRELGIRIKRERDAVEWRIDGLVVRDIYSDTRELIEADMLVTVTARLPDDALFQAMEQRAGELHARGVTTWEAIGDSHCPGTIAAAVWSGYRYSFELEQSAESVAMKRQVHGELFPD